MVVLPHAGYTALSWLTERTRTRILASRQPRAPSPVLLLGLDSAPPIAAAVHHGVPTLLLTWTLRQRTPSWGGWGLGSRKVTVHRVCSGLRGPSVRPGSSHSRQPAPMLRGCPWPCLLHWAAAELDGPVRVLAPPWPRGLSDTCIPSPALVSFPPAPGILSGSASTWTCCTPGALGLLLGL